MAQLFGTDRVRLYDVDPWNRLGFGVPAFRPDTIGTLNAPIHGLADEVAKIQLYIMTHVDVMRTKPPSTNTIQRIGKMLNRVASVLGGRQMDYPDMRLEEGHVRPDQMIWNIHPVPYFPSAFVRNRWLKEWNHLVMVALSNMYQHSENNLSLEITKEFAQDVYAYFARIKRLMGYEMLQIPVAELDKPDFMFKAEHYANYHPDEVTINIEALDYAGPLFSLPTEADMRQLLDGIPATLILPRLKQYPIGPVPGAQGIGGQDLIDESLAAEGTGGIGGGGGPAIGGDVNFPSSTEKQGEGAAAGSSGGSSVMGVASPQI